MATPTPAWRAAARRGGVPVALGLLLLLLSWPATEDLGPLLTGLGVILVVLGLVIVVATARTLTAEERRRARLPRSAQPPAPSAADTSGASSPSVEPSTGA